MAAHYLGVDFGTTNTPLSVAGPAGPPELLRFPAAEGGESATWPSLLYFEPVAEVGELARCFRGLQSTARRGPSKI